MGITASQVNELRKATGAGMMDCKNALNETNGDMDAAIDYLRKKGQKISDKRADRESNEGVVIAKTNDDSTKGIVVELNCETDFVAKNADFVAFAEKIADAAMANFPADKEALLALTIDGTSIKDHLLDQMAKIGEKIEVSNYEHLEGTNVVSYIHAGNKIGVLVALTVAGDAAADAGKDAAMQIAAMKPLAVSKDGIAQEVIDRELEIAREQVIAEGKPENMIDKIAQGKLGKFFKENTLLSQSFVKDPSKSVEAMLKAVDSNLTITNFRRLGIGA
ncbi:elongation factor Ts [bacterium]|nr:elongation factor Ts [bacterium]